MLIEIISGLLGIGLGSVSGYKFRQIKEPKLPNMIFPPNDAEGTYEVRCNGTKVYCGNDLQKAKERFKSDIYSRGSIIELYNSGNHVVSRSVQ